MLHLYFIINKHKMKKASDKKNDGRRIMPTIETIR